MLLRGVQDILQSNQQSLPAACTAVLAAVRQLHCTVAAADADTPQQAGHDPPPLTQ